MRFDIRSNKDRVGITQEILSVFSDKQWNLVAVEMFLYHTLVQFDENISSHEIEKALSGIDNITGVDEVDLLPGERRSQHLEAVLSMLQDPIIDINPNGKILLGNAAAASLLGTDRKGLQNLNITDYIDTPLDTLLPMQSSSIEISLANQTFIVDITPMVSYNNHIKSVSGAVLQFQSLRRLGQQISAVTHTPNENTSSLIGSSEITQELIKSANRFSRLDMPVLIQGETGTGKELIAHMLHENGSRSGAPFMAINCAALPENLLESELFGYAPGAFSGANKQGKPGLLELADGGSIFLDEIGEMSLYLQAKLLRFLQEYSFRRIGGDKEISVDVRVISATHRDLLEMADQKHFREDLFYRLNVLNLQVPPLRKRRADIPALVHHFVNRAAEQVNNPPPEVSAEAMSLLMEYSWPGNIRELQNILFRSIATTDEQTLTPEHLSINMDPSSKKEAYEEINDWDSAINQHEKKILETLYPQYPSSRKLAKRLGISHNTVAVKLRKYGIAT